MLVICISLALDTKEFFLLFQAQIRSSAADIAGQRVEIPQLHPLSEGNSARTRTFAKTDGHSTPTRRTRAPSVVQWIVRHR